MFCKLLIVLFIYLSTHLLTWSMFDKLPILLSTYLLTYLPTSSHYLPAYLPTYLLLHIIYLLTYMTNVFTSYQLSFLLIYLPYLTMTYGLEDVFIKMKLDMNSLGVHTQVSNNNKRLPLDGELGGC